MNTDFLGVEQQVTTRVTHKKKQLLVSISNELTASIVKYVPLIQKRKYHVLSFELRFCVCCC